FSSTSGSPVAPRTLRRRVDGPLAREQRRARLRVARRRPLHVGDLRDGTPVGAGIAVAVETPAHTERRHLRDGLHLVDAAVAGDAADAGGDVRAMREVGV